MVKEPVRKKSSCILFFPSIGSMLPSAGWHKPKEFRISNFNNFHVWSQYGIFQNLDPSYSCVPAERQQERSWALMRSSHRQRVPAHSSPAPSSSLPTRPLSATWDQHTTEINAIEYRSNKKTTFGNLNVLYFLYMNYPFWKDNIIEIGVFVSHSCLCVSSRLCKQHKKESGNRSTLF